MKNYLWILPFCSFVLGYSFMQWFFCTQEIPAPHLVGKHIHEVMPLIAHHNLNLKLIDQKEDKDLPEGIILNQTPSAGTAIKQRQHIFIVTTKKPATLPTPNCINEKIETIISKLRDTGINLRIYHIMHPYPAGLCFAQSPQAHEPLEKRLLIYVSSGNNKPIIWPSFIGYNLKNAQDLLDMHAIKPYIINNSININMFNSTIVEQRPLAGTLLTLDEKQPLSVQLRIE